MRNTCHNDLYNTIHVKQIVTIFYKEFSKNYFYHGENHNFWELVYIDKGEMIATAGDTQHLLSQGELIFHKPREFHNLSSNGRSAANVVIISFVSLSPPLKMLEERIMAIPFYIQKILAQLMREAQWAYKSLGAVFDPRKRNIDSVFGAEQMVYQYLEIFLMQICRLIKSGDAENSLFRQQEQNGMNHKLIQDVESGSMLIVQPIIAYLVHNVYNNLKFETICRTFYMSATQLKRVFRETTNTSVMSYFRTLKLEEAKKLIREEQNTFTEIGNLLGFESVHYFSTAFKRYTGMSPTDYKKSIQYLEGQNIVDNK